MRLFKPFGPVLLGLILLAAVSAIVIQVEHVHDREYDERGHAAAETVQREIDGHITTLLGLKGLALANSDLDRSDWRIFLDSLSPLNRLDTARGFGFAKAFDKGGIDPRPSYLAAYGLTVSASQPQGPRAFPIVILEPDDARNRAALGYDMYSEPIRREAMDRAAQSGQPAVSGIVRLKQEVSGAVQPGFLIYVPARAGEKLLGFVYAPYRFDDFFRGAGAPLMDLGYGLTIRSPGGDAQFSTGPDDGHRYVSRLRIADQWWPVEVVLPRPALSDASIALLALGVVLALLVPALMLLQQRRLHATQALANERQRRVAEADLMMREMAHRLKNGFARIGAIAMLTARQTADKAEFLERFNSRLALLARSKEMLLAGQAGEATLRDLVARELEVAAVDQPSQCIQGPAVAVSGPEHWVLSLCVHELVTNSIKYGALSGNGQLSCRIAEEDGWRSIDWHERLDRAVASTPEGFGTEFVDTLLARNLRGTVQREIAGHDVRVVLRWPAGTKE